MSLARWMICPLVPQKNFVSNKIATREKIDFTDKELYCIALAIESHLNSRDTFFTKKSAIMFNKMVQKIIDAGLKRKSSESILHPIVRFNDE